jgi:RNA polymerase sigma factor (sigma-70 family)
LIYWCLRANRTILKKDCATGHNGCISHWGGIADSGKFPGKSFRPPVNTMDTTVSSLSTPTLLADPHLDSATPDAYLLGEFVSCQDEAAFAELVKRHGGLVRGVCRRILLDPAAADDAFQHTFLSLAQHAPLLLRTVAPTASLGSWLYRVAVNASLQLKRKARSRRRTETQFAEHRPNADSPQEPWNEVLPALDEEISALPGQYRSAVVKCHLEGKTQQDAAKELGITYATLRRRLKEARGMLRNRLSERGFAHNGFLLIPLLGHLVASDPVSAQTASAVTTTVLSAGSAQATAATASVVSSTTAGSTAAAGGSLSLFTKIMAVNPFVKCGLAGVLMFGVVGSWWMVNSQTPADEQTVESAAASDQSNETGEQTPPAKPVPEDSLLHSHFAYVLQHGQTLSPEFENAVQALHDTDANRSRRLEPGTINLPELKNSRETLRDVTLGAPLPKNGDLLSQTNPAMLAEPATKWGLPDDPNYKLLVPSPKTEREPLPVEKVMEFLNEEQERRSQFSVGPAIPASSQFFGHPTSQPSKTLKVITLP